ncbi:MAG: class I SAM-dependent methyltransferase [Bryobacteraceae bacterium]
MMAFDPAEYKRFEREAYNAVAAAWAANVAETTALYSRRLLELLKPGRGASLLDLACGAGHLARDAVSRFGCRAAGVDLSEGMLQHARPLGVCADAEHLPFRDATFDIVASGLGLMYFPDPALALEEIRRVVRPGGRVGFVVWPLAPRTAALRVAVSSFAETIAPPPVGWLLRIPGIGERVLFRVLEDTIPGKGPSPFRFGRPGKLESALERAGFSGISVVEHTEVWRYAGFDEFWRNFVRSTPSAQPGLSPETVARVRARMEQKSRDYANRGALAFPMTALLAVALNDNPDR